MGKKFPNFIREGLLSVPVGWKIIGIGLLPVLILGVTLNYWVTTGLADWLSYILTDVRVEAAMVAGSRSVTFVTILAAVGSIFLALFFTHLLTRPILELRQTAEKVADGEYHTRASVWASDEIGSLAVSVNQMIDNFVNYQEDLADTNRQLKAINRISLAADRNIEIHDFLYLVLDNLLDLVDLEMGWVYLFEPETRMFHLASWHSVPAELEGYLIHQRGEPRCECQEQILQGTLGEEIRVISCGRMEHCDCPGIAGSHITIPIAARDELFGTINLSYPEQRDLPEDKIELLNSVGAQVSEIVSNAWLQMKLNEKEENRQLLLESLVSAQEDERRRLSRELHDRSGQTLTSLLVRLKTLQERCDQPELDEEIRDLQEIVSHSIDQLREISYRLRPPALEEFGLAPALEALLERMFESVGVRVKFLCGVEGDLNPDTEVVLYRIAQEGLANILHHAEANLVTVELGQRGECHYLRVEDDGVGFDTTDLSRKRSQQHLGLISMKERSEIIGGWMDLSSVPGQGTKLEVYVPQRWEES